jgi:hypothetical protein
MPPDRPVTGTFTVQHVARPVNPGAWQRAWDVLLKRPQPPPPLGNPLSANAGSCDGKEKTAEES